MVAFDLAAGWTGGFDLALAEPVFFTSQLRGFDPAAAFCWACEWLLKKHKMRKQAATARHLLPNDLANVMMRS